MMGKRSMPFIYAQIQTLTVKHYVLWQSRKCNAKFRNYCIRDIKITLKKNVQRKFPLLLLARE